MTPHINNKFILILATILFSILFFFVLENTSAKRLESTINPAYEIQNNKLSQFTADEVTVTPTVEEYSIYMPIILSPKILEVELQDVWITDNQEKNETAFQPSQEMIYVVTGTNHLTTTATVNLRWTQNDPCNKQASQLVYSDTLTLEPGIWQHKYSSTTPDCSGTIYPTAELIFDNIAQTSGTEFAINRTSTIFISGEQGFDKCGLPDVWKMQQWWDYSPYQVFNLYLGGISFACSKNPLDALWARKVADQGWTYILTWVGPQAPCTTYSNKISENNNTAYNEGKQEAQAAAEAAYNLGFYGNKIIYYDIEAYPNASSTCRTAVRYFIRGWTERLHQLGFKAGGYGSPCSSYQTDWDSNEPPPDDVWIATLNKNYYDPNATVWNVPCLSNNLWDNHQRIHQYAGTHTETWGEITIYIDSNVLDGEITALDMNDNTSKATSAGTKIDVFGTPVTDLGLFNSTQGWVLSNERLLITSNNGNVWFDITPAGAEILGAAFLEANHGWAVSKENNTLVAYKTNDGGSSWNSTPLPLTIEQSQLITKAYLHPLDEQVVWLSLKLQSGSSFSQGLLFFSDDSGNTWQERTIPIGENVKFINEMKGWTAGGVLGNQLYSTRDGGRTWQLQHLPDQANGQFDVGLPVFENQREGWLPVTVTIAGSDKLVIYRTNDGGRSWDNIKTLSIQPLVVDSGATLFDATKTMSLTMSLESIPNIVNNLPNGAIKLDFIDAENGWVVVQQGECQGNKKSPDEWLSCKQFWQLLATQDGGRSWHELTISGQ